jgi:hypothetical protein
LTTRLTFFIIGLVFLFFQYKYIHFIERAFEWKRGRERRIYYSCTSPFYSYIYIWHISMNYSICCHIAKKGEFNIFFVPIYNYISLLLLKVFVFDQYMYIYIWVTYEYNLENENVICSCFSFFFAFFSTSSKWYIFDRLARFESDFTQYIE